MSSLRSRPRRPGTRVGLAAALLAALCTAPKVRAGWTHRDHATLRKEFAALARAHPRVDLVPLGPTHEEREMFAVRVRGERPERRVLLISGQHGSEQLPVLFAQEFLEHLLSGARSTPDLGVYPGAAVSFSELLASTDLWLVPVANPDGYDYRLGGSGRRVPLRSNRVTRRPDGRQAVRCVPPRAPRRGRASIVPACDASCPEGYETVPLGSNLARNYPYDWQGERVRSCEQSAAAVEHGVDYHDNFPGTAPATLPEVQQLLNLINNGSFHLVVDLHDNLADFSCSRRLLPDRLRRAGIEHALCGGYPPEGHPGSGSVIPGMARLANRSRRNASSTYYRLSQRGYGSGQGPGDWFYRLGTPAVLVEFASLRHDNGQVPAWVVSSWVQTQFEPIAFAIAHADDLFIWNQLHADGHYDDVGVTELHGRPCAACPDALATRVGSRPGEPMVLAGSPGEKSVTCELRNWGVATAVRTPRLIVHDETVGCRAELNAEAVEIAPGGRAEVSRRYRFEPGHGYRIECRADSRRVVLSAEPGRCGNLDVAATRPHRDDLTANDFRRRSFTARVEPTLYARPPAPLPGAWGPSSMACAFGP